MSDLDLLIRDAFDAQVPLRVDRRPAWDDVLARAGVTPSTDGGGLAALARRRRRRRRLVLALAAVVIGVIVVGSALAALGQNPFGGLTSWLHGSPGKPAPAADQAGFAARNNASYAAFPRGTRLRLLLRERVGGKTFNLLGFRNRSSLCLRLVRADLPAGLGATQCVTLRELRHSPAPALVAAAARSESPVTQSFRFGRPELTVDGIFGFADDTVRAVALRSASGSRQTADVAGNVFVALRARPSKAVYDQISEVRALTHDGREVPVPFVGDFGQYVQGRPGVPSYYGQVPVLPGQLPGPAQAEASFPGGTIAWLAAREPRGKPFVDAVGASVFGRFVFARSVQPDPESPFRVGVALTTGPPHAVVSRNRPHPRRTWLQPGRRTLCFSALDPLVGHPGSTACVQPTASGSFFRPGLPVELGEFFNSQITRIYGLAADPVREIDLYLASGRVIPAALRSNVFTIEAPTTQFPAKLVAYDAKRRSIWVYVPNALTPAKLTACPAARFTGPLATLPPPKPYERLDLGTGKVNGQPILGRSPPEVEAALGRPDFVDSGLELGQRYTAFFFGGRRRRPIGDRIGWTDAALVISFGRRRHGFRATSLSYEGATLVDARLGHVLRLQPPELQRKIASTYASRYRLDVAYGDPNQLGCGASFRARTGRVELSFGLRPWLSRRPYLTLRHPH